MSQTTTTPYMATTFSMRASYASVPASLKNGQKTKTRPLFATYDEDCDYDDEDEDYEDDYYEDDDDEDDGEDYEEDCADESPAPITAPATKIVKILARIKRAASCLLF